MKWDFCSLPENEIHFELTSDRCVLRQGWWAAWAAFAAAVGVLLQAAHYFLYR